MSDDEFTFFPEDRPKVFSIEDLEKRVAELSADYRRFRENTISITSKAEPQASAREQGGPPLPGYLILKRCKEVLETPPLNSKDPPTSPPNDNSTPAQRRAILLNLIWGWSAYRFVARKVDMQATAASRWVESYQTILASPDSSDMYGSHRYRLLIIESQLRGQIDEITDEFVDNALRTEDTSKGYSIDEDPILQKTLLWFRTPH